jgi:hypothetical protein
MARYIQRISLLGKERWIGWEIDGIGTEIPGLALADGLSEEDLRARGVKEFRALPFESFLGMSSTVAMAQSGELLDQDVDFRLDALLVGMERIRSRGVDEVPRAVLTAIFQEEQLSDPRVQARLREWQTAGQIELVGREDCYLKITGRLA